MVEQGWSENITRTGCPAPSIELNRPATDLCEKHTGVIPRLVEGCVMNSFLKNLINNVEQVLQTNMCKAVS